MKYWMDEIDVSKIDNLYKRQDETFVENMVIMQAFFSQSDREVNSLMTDFQITNLENLILENVQVRRNEAFFRDTYETDQNCSYK